MSRKEIFDNKQVILFSLTDDLGNYVHSSIRLYLAKNSGNIHLTSRVDLDNCRCRIFSIVRSHPFYYQNESYFYSLDFEFVQQKGNEYDYILFRS